jgi:hypothetical protein
VVLRNLYSEILGTCILEILGIYSEILRQLLCTLKYERLSTRRQKRG